MDRTADIIVVGAGVQGASLAFHLSLRGARVLVLERSSIAAGATGRSSGFVRMHYDLESEVRLAHASHRWFIEWREMVGEGDCGFVGTGFVQMVPPELGDNLRANVTMQQRVGVETSVLDPSELGALLPGIVLDDGPVAAYEPLSGYADPSGTAAGFLAAARRDGARLVQGCRVLSVLVEGDRVTGVRSDQGDWWAPMVVDAAGAWAAELASSAGLEVPVQPWRHDTAYFGLPPGRGPGFPIVIDEANAVYFRPEGRDLMLVGLEAGNTIGGSPDRPFQAMPSDSIEDMVRRVCARLPWMESGTLRATHGGQDGITPDQRPILGQAGPEGFFLVCGLSGTGFKTAPAIGACMSELILDGGARTADISRYGLERFAEGRPLVGEYPYGMLWR